MEFLFLVLDSIIIPKSGPRPEVIKTSYGTNMVLMPDGRYKTAPPPPVIRGSATSQLSKLLTSGQVMTAGPQSATSSTARASKFHFFTQFTL